MEQILSLLDETNITPNEDDNRTKYDILYKNWGRLSNQDERRREFLEHQKKNRYTKLDKFRGVVSLVNAVEESTEIFGEEPREKYEPKVHAPGFNRASTSYSDVLMLSEWMIEKPFDFEINWMVVPAPKGTRTLMVASKGTTRIYNKLGHLMYQCETGVPGGNSGEPRKSGRCCVLDGIFQKKTKTMYILDVLAWNSQNMTDGDLLFRDFWLKSHVMEADIKSIHMYNELNFILLPKTMCSTDAFQRFMIRLHFNEDITSMDGLLFYHKKATYFAGETPLVSWLYPFMVPEVIGDIVVHPAYMLQRPENYINQTAFITEFEERKEKKAKAKEEHLKRKMNRRRFGDGCASLMDTAEVSSEATASGGAAATPVTSVYPTMHWLDLAASVTSPSSETATATEKTDMDAN